MRAARARLGLGLSRSRAVALVVMLGLVLFGLTLPVWARAVATTTVGAETVTVGGSDAAPAVASAALVILVAGLVLALSGRVTRVLAVTGVVVGGALAVFSSARFLADPVPALVQAAAAVSGVPQIEGEPEVTAFPVLALVVGVLALVVGAALPLLAGSWRVVGRRYEVGASTPRRGGDPRTRAMDDWDAISRGDDPSGR